MESKSNRAFSLLEVIITVAILSTAIVFVFRAFTTVLSSVRFSQNINQACFFAEDQLWKIENNFPLTANPEEENTPQTKFTYNYTLTDTDIPELKQLKLVVSWEEKRKNPYSLEFFTYILTKNQ